MLGNFPPLVGTGAQGQKVFAARLVVFFDRPPGTYAYKAAFDCDVFLISWGGGGSADGNGKGGNGGDAIVDQFRLHAGQTLRWRVGAGGVATAGGVTPGTSGQDSWIRVDDGRLWLAAGGRGGNVGGTLSASRAKYVSHGGLGGQNNVNGTDGEHGGGLGGLSSAGGPPNYGGGGGAGGLVGSGAEGIPGNGGLLSSQLPTYPAGGGNSNAGSGGFAGRDGVVRMGLVRAKRIA